MNTYKCEYESGEFAIIECDEDKIFEYAFELEEENGSLFNIFLVDNIYYDEIETII